MEHKKEQVSICPICASKKLKEHLHLEDYFFTKEKFIIQKCEHCGFELTNPRPTKNTISSYYKTENYISHSNKNRGVFAGLYQFARKINLSLKYSIIEKHAAKGKALDIGTGTGHFLNYLQKKGWKVQGIEPDEKTAEFARENFQLKIDSENKLSILEKSSFDLISLWHVLEHVHNLNERMAEIRRLIKPEGLVILALPNPESLDSNYYVKYWAAYDVPRHLYHFRKEDIYRLAKKHQLSVEKIYPMRLDAFYVSLLSEKYIGKKWGLFRAIFIALRSNWKSSAKNPNTSSLIYLLRPIKA